MGPRLRPGREGSRLNDRIFIEGIKFHGYHGLTRMERQIGVRLSVDVSLWIDLERSARSDSVRYTVDYRKVHERVVAIGRGSSHKLLESFVASLLDALFDEFKVDRIAVRVRKETPVLDGIVDSVGVEMVRAREEWAAR
ncbi:MAG: dihydroneopterin aldolase [Acidobacteria bacterium]|nr:MAG: dihydroneopterin aldolase [Acidobacteriota bacterium]